MTVIAAVVDRDAGRVHMAADAVSDYGNMVVRGPKIDVLDCSGQAVLLAWAGRAAVSAVVLSRARPVDPPPDHDGADRWAQATAERATETAVAANLKDSDGDFDGAGLLAWSDRLWIISHHLAQPAEAYAAVGSGAPCALGALWATRRRRPVDRAHVAVQAAIEHYPGIGGPITTAST